MNGKTARVRAGEARFAGYLDALAPVLRHSGRAGPMRAYCRGLLLPGERKSVELMAARLGSDRVRSLHQSLHHVVAQAAWDDAALLAAVGQQVIPLIARTGPPRYFTVNDISCARQGIHSVGVTRQAGNSSDAHENCQVSVSLWLSNEAASLPIAHRLFLPADWSEHKERRTAAGVPPDIRFETRAAIALRQLRDAMARGMRPAVVLDSAGYGETTEFRSGLEALGLSYMLTSPAALRVWRAGASGARTPRQGRTPVPDQQASSALDHALALPARAWRTFTLRGNGRLGAAARFAALRVRLRGAGHGGPADPDRWLLMEWPPDMREPTGFWLSDLPPHVPLRSLVWTARSARRVAADCQELKQTIGLAHYEGRGWRGHHHHASLCVAAYGFLVAERCAYAPRQRYCPGLAAELPLLPGIRSLASR